MEKIQVKPHPRYMKTTQVNPPAWIRKIFEWYCPADLAEDLLGDMDELFYQNLDKMAPAKAKRKYCLQSLSLLVSYAVKSRKRNQNMFKPDRYNSFAMYRSYSKIAFRSLAKQKVFSVINVICLSVGMSVGLLALGALVDVLQVDNFQTNRARIYRVTSDVDDKSAVRTFASASAPLSEKLREESTGVEEVVSMSNTFTSEVVMSSDISIPFRDGYYATANFFKVFTFPLIEGNPATALEKPFSIVLTEETAKKLYRETSPLGKIMEIKGLGNFEVTGVVKDHPRSHFLFEAIASYSTIAVLEQQSKIGKVMNNWGPITDHYTYLLTNSEEVPASLEKFLASTSKEVNAQLAKGKDQVSVTYGLQSINDIPLSEVYNDIGLDWGYASLMVFFFLAVLVLLPACFNYTNISIARSLKRAKEIGLRKVSGGESRHIFMQMVMETVIISVISLGGAMLIFLVVRREFLNMIVEGEKTFSLQITPLTFFIFLAFAIVTGFIAGAFPATYFSKLNPIQTLRNSSANGKLSKISIRKGLIVAQFALSMVFILGVAIIVKQYHYALNFDFGFQKENILDVPLKGVDEKIFRNEISKLSDVRSVSMSSAIPGNFGAVSEYININEGKDSLEVYEMFVDENYISNLEIELLAGSAFPEGTSTVNEQYIVVNQTFLSKLNIATPHEALGKSFEFGDRNLSITGVIKDFNFMPLQEQIYPFAFRVDPKQFAFANLKVKSDNIHQTLADIESTWNKMTDQKFEAQFLEHELDASLQSFESMVKIFGFLGLLAITISCLGLLAVVISSAESRTREMGIRKVFGASTGNIAVVMSTGFLKLIAIAVIIATPLTYIMFEQVFLRMFFHRASIGFVEIAASIVLLFSLVLLIIGSQTFRVAKINPVETLKYE